MKLTDVLPPENVVADAPGGSKKRVLENLSSFLSERMDTVTADELYQGLLSRERLGSTGIGEGVAIPHCRLGGCEKITAALIKLQEPVDFDSIDGEEVDLIFALIVPEEQNDQHLQILSAIAELLQDETVRNQLRQADSNDALYRIAVNET
ncbi:PTS IIA-like nitrogen regulatory protein PtsN [Porticoccus litoralis]|jgi:PTS system nitrogen regulatory IIA component|uniref:PTS IIA-like nitrogen regulatory protein PtsN n=1 Tax=Porticoccus litoralis TaxID=434086 RepID=A0AAW8B2T4_9GAMM|nr:PTS IIA-like nitrogen regulatory protein PtsN [Porticoccus litoralis]MDP1520074.1 PTS IIA-like nitrogen regulatory protein PtsN [Porticoccus litoralis]